MRLFSSVIVGTLCAAAAACVGISGLSGGDAKSASDSGADALTPPGIAVKPAALDFGPAGCRTQVPPQSVTLENQGAAPIHYEASLPEASGFALGGQRQTTVSGDILPQGLTVLTINVAALITLGPLKTKLTLKWDDRIAEVPISVTGLGAKLDADPKIVDFGDVYYMASATSDVALRNSGTEALTVTGLDNLGTDFTLDTLKLPLTIAAGASTSVKLRQVAGAIQDTPKKTDVTVTTGAAPVCGEVTTLSLQGRRVDADLTINPGTVDFGRQGCNTTPAARQFTVNNYAPASLIVSPATASRYTLSPSGPTTIPAGILGGPPGTLVFTLTPKAIALPIGDVNESIDLDFGAPKGIKSTTAHVLVTGVVLGIAPDILELNPSQTKSFVVTNKGNVNAVTVYTSSSPYFTVVKGDTVFPNVGSNMAVTYTPPDQAQYSATITTTLEVPSLLCAPVPTVTVQQK